MEISGNWRNKPAKSGKNLQFTEISGKGRKKKEIFEFGTKRPRGKPPRTSGGGNFVGGFLKLKGLSSPVGSLTY